IRARARDQARDVVVVVARGAVVVVLVAAVGGGRPFDSAARALARRTRSSTARRSRAHVVTSPLWSAASAWSDSVAAAAPSCATVALAGGCTPVGPVVPLGWVVVVVDPLLLLLLPVFPLTLPLSACCSASGIVPASRLRTALETLLSSTAFSPYVTAT